MRLTTCNHSAIRFSHEEVFARRAHFFEVGQPRGDDQFVIQKGRAQVFDVMTPGNPGRARCVCRLSNTKRLSMSNRRIHIVRVAVHIDCLRWNPQRKLKNHRRAWHGFLIFPTAFDLRPSQFIAATTG